MPSIELHVTIDLDNETPESTLELFRSKTQALESIVETAIQIHLATPAPIPEVQALFNAYTEVEATIEDITE